MSGRVLNTNILLLYTLLAFVLTLFSFPCLVSGNESLYIIFQLWPNDAFVHCTASVYYILGSVCYLSSYCTNKNELVSISCFNTLPWKFCTLVRRPDHTEVHFFLNRFLYHKKHITEETKSYSKGHDNLILLKYRLFFKNQTVYASQWDGCCCFSTMSLEMSGWR